MVSSLLDLFAPYILPLPIPCDIGALESVGAQSLQEVYNRGNITCQTPRNYMYIHSIKFIARSYRDDPEESEIERNWQAPTLVITLPPYSDYPLYYSHSSRHSTNPTSTRSTSKLARA